MKYKNTLAYSVTKILFLSLVLCALIACTPRASQTLKEVVDTLNERQVAHCLFAQGAVPPYGQLMLYARAGNLDCELLWRGDKRP